MDSDSPDLLNVIDIEATCWDGQPPPGAVSEIIEIGLTVVDLRAAEGGSPLERGRELAEGSPATGSWSGPPGPRSAPSAPG